MRVYDWGTALFWLFFAVAVMVQSLRMGVGTLANPGMGFMAFGSSGVMGVLSLILLIQSSVRPRDIEPPARPFAGLMVGRVIGVVGAVFFYTLFLPSLGYLIATFLLMACLLLIVGKRKRWLLICFPGLTSLISYYIFAKLFNCQFPAGILGF